MTSDKKEVEQRLEKALWILRNPEIHPIDKMTPLYNEISISLEKFKKLSITK